MQDELKGFIIGLAMYLVRNNPDSMQLSYKTLQQLSFLVEFELAALSNEEEVLH